MREIKFRAYDKLNGEMVYSHKKEDGYLFDLENGIVRCCVEQATFDVCGDEYIDIYDLGNLMQYTGIDDSSGIEIYEGDLISDDDEIGQVVFYEGSFIVKWQGFADNLCESSNTCEVIGNIYENPELLEVK